MRVGAPDRGAWYPFRPGPRIRQPETPGAMTMKIASASPLVLAALMGFAVPAQAQIPAAAGHLEKAKAKAAEGGAVAEKKTSDASEKAEAKGDESATKVQEKATAVSPEAGAKVGEAKTAGHGKAAAVKGEAKAAKAKAVVKTKAATTKADEKAKAADEKVQAVLPAAAPAPAAK
jgi:hypothetical protein